MTKLFAASGALFWSSTMLNSPLFVVTTAVYVLLASRQLLGAFSNVAARASLPSTAGHGVSPVIARPSTGAVAVVSTVVSFVLVESEPPETEIMRATPTTTAMKIAARVASLRVRLRCCCFAKSSSRWRRFSFLRLRLSVPMIYEGYSRPK